MKHLKQFLRYGLWTLLSILLGMVYMRLVLGPNDLPQEGFGFLARMFYNWGLLYVGLIVGLVIALLFVLLDRVYLKRKLKNNRKATTIRFVALLGITTFVIVVHYVLEKVIDII